jgi:hypothetical protein
VSTAPRSSGADDDGIWDRSRVATVEDREGLPVLEDAALHGLAGRVVTALDPHTEADRAAVLATFLALFGVLVGTGPHARVGGAQHPARLNVVMVGKTSKARKGQTMQDVLPIMRNVDSAFFDKGGMLDGFGSGEILVDAAAKRVEDDELGRMLLFEPEFARLLDVCSREGSTLSSVVRNAYDGGVLAARSRTKTSEAKGATVHVLGHITQDELRSSMTSLQAGNGFGNRFMYFAVRRSKRLPSGGRLTEGEVGVLGVEVGLAVESAVTRREITRTRAAEAVWSRMYDAMADDDPGGLVGSMTARAEAHVLRLSVTYALLDDADHIGVDHLAAAWAVWRYARASAQILFGAAVGDSRTEKVLAFIRAHPKGVSSTDIHRHLGNNVTAMQRAVILERLEDAGLVKTETTERPGPGRRPVVTRALPWDASPGAGCLPAFDAFLRSGPPGTGGPK